MFSGGGLVSPSGASGGLPEHVDHRGEIARRVRVQHEHADVAWKGPGTEEAA